MTMGLGLARLAVIVAGIAIAAVGLFLIAVPGGPGTVLGVYTVLGGFALIVGALIERVRYRSEAGDRDGAPPGPAGGEPPGTTLDPRFRRTDEVFADPTSGRRMRVWLDPSSGERRYVTED
jgi:hypothetical protein